MEQLYIAEYEEGGMGLYTESEILKSPLDFKKIYKADNLTEVKLTTSFTAVTKEKRIHTKHKKHNHLKECPECGKKYKGIQGLAIHRVKHGVRGNTYQKQNEGNV